MIRGFWVKNYLSIRNKQELNFLAKGSSSQLIIGIVEEIFLYKLRILYSSNTSVKSNMLIALNELFRFWVLPKSDAAQRINGSIPFILTENEPTQIHVSFYANGIRYDYDVEFNDKYILNESLYHYPNKSKSLFYKHMFIGDNVQAEIKFRPSLKLLVKPQDSIRENPLNNHSVLLSVCRKTTLKEVIAPLNILHGWIMENYYDVEGDDKKGVVEILKDAYNNSKKYKFYNAMLQKADLNILEYSPIVENRFVINEFREHIQKGNIPEDMKEALLNPASDSVAFIYHPINRDFDSPLKWQSKGTQKYICILEALYDMVTNSHVYYLNELDGNLHYDLLYYYLYLFIFSSEKSQLIITCQETTLLFLYLINENRGVKSNIVDHTALYANKKVQLVGNPFLLDTLGPINYFTPQTKRMEYLLEHKYKHTDYLNYLPPIMAGGKFQGANQPDFSNAVTLYTLTEESDFRYMTITTSRLKAFRYIRYLASDKTNGNMAEVEFYTTENDQPLQGKVAGEHEPSIYYPCNTADKIFDGNTLTFFHTNDSLAWGGLDLGKSTIIDHIRYIIRNNDNGIRKRHEYDLSYMKEGVWVLLGKQIAIEDDLCAMSTSRKEHCFSYGIIQRKQNGYLQLKIKK